MPCTPIDGGVICTTEMQEVHQEVDGKPRWCFSCRSRQTFIYVIMVPVVPSYYGPSPSIRCDTCTAIDGDLFPGRSREWD